MTAVTETRVLQKGVLLLGSGYGALKVAEDMAQAGIPVIWVTRAHHFLELPQDVQRVPEWPEDLDFQFRPLYLRVTRHPLVTPLTRARVESLERVEEGCRVVVEQDPIYIDYDLCTGCGRCVEVGARARADPLPLSRTPAYCPSRALELDKRTTAPCRLGCPLGINVQAYMALTAAGRFEEALDVVREDNPLPGICGRVCDHPCEAACRRGELDQPVAICDVKRFLSDYAATRTKSEEGAAPAQPAPATEAKGAGAEPPAKDVVATGPRDSGTVAAPGPHAVRGDRVAIIGSGPAGLTAAHYLAREGFRPTIFEALPLPGGMLRWGIPAYRLPRDVLEAEIRDILDLGVELRCSTRAGTDVTLEELERDFDAVLIAAGAQRSAAFAVPGADAHGCYGAIEFLRAHHQGETPSLGDRVAVVGGGNSAIDAARTALRLGAEVTLFYRRACEDMPAEETEVAAAEAEGVSLEFHVTPTRVLTADDRVTGLELIRMEPGEEDETCRQTPIPIPGSEFSVPVDTVIYAIGQGSELDFLCHLDGWEGGRGTIAVDGDMRTCAPWLWAGGDVVTGPSTVVASMAHGKIAAKKIIEHLSDRSASILELPPATRGTGDPVPISDDLLQLPRQEMALRQARVRRKDFEEVGLGLTMDQAVAEAKRCLQCSACCECRSCEEVCGDVGAIDHFREPRRLQFLSPAVLVADDQEMPPGDYDGFDDLFRMGEFNEDLMTMMVAGSASAGRALALATPLRSGAVPEPAPSRDRSQTTRLGVFVCTCNSTMAPAPVLARILEMVAQVPEMAHTELVFSACHPRGAGQIADAVRERELNRVILASCACCPLEFQCISCNDQRNRTRIHLFDEQGLDRSTFEMINLRDHLSGDHFTEADLVRRAQDLFRDALIRMRYLGPLRQGVTEIGKDVLILGASEIGVSAALNLDLQGFRVRLVHRCRAAEEAGEAVEGPAAETAWGAAAALDTALAGRSITHIPQATIENIAGHIGEFKVRALIDGRRVAWRTDIICLTDENVLSLAIPEDLAGLKKFYRYNFAFFHSPQPGLYRVLPRTLDRVSEFEAGAALAAQVARGSAEVFLKDHELSPRVDPDRCRGCGRCVEICPFDAVHLRPDSNGAYTAEVLRYNCVGCGGCVGLCPVTALDMPYFSNKLLEELLAGALQGER